MQMNRLILGTTSAALLCGAAVAGTAVTSAAATQSDQPGALTQQSATNSDYSITGATTFISINHSGEVILQAPNSDEYTMTGCSARLTSSGAQFSNCTGEGSSAFFGGQTPTSAVLSNVAEDGQAHAGQLVLSTADGSTFTATISTVNFPLQGSGSGCVFHPDSTTSAFSCTGGTETK